VKLNIANKRPSDDFMFDFSVSITPEITSYKIILVDDNISPYLKYPLKHIITFSGKQHLLYFSKD